MVIQFNFHSPENALWRRLSGFGLNPADWIVRRLRQKTKSRPLVTPQIFCAINRSEPSWVLIGEAKNISTSWDWRSLELCDISAD